MGVPKTATDDEIKKAFRRLAHEHHPDKGGDQQKFKDVNEAYQVLGNTEKRRTYDQFGSAAFSAGGGSAYGGEQGGPGGAQGFGQGFGGFNINMDDLGDFGDILGGMFGVGGRKSGRRASRGKDIETEVTIDFLESVKETERRIKLYKHEACSVCSGSGAEPGSKIETCKTCEGRGQVSQSVRTIFGMMQHAATCPECNGVGSKPSALCRHCKGIGMEKKTKEISLTIPAGINTGEALKLSGEGEHPGHGGRAGDLYIRVMIKSHPTFIRKGNDVHSTFHLPYSTLALGGSVEIETVDGHGSLTIPEATEPGAVFKIRGKGFPSLRSSNRGDHLVTVQPLVQRKLTKDQRRVLEDLRRAGL